MVILANLQERGAKVDRALAKWREMKLNVKMEKKRYQAYDHRFERKWLQTTPTASALNGQTESQPMNEEPLSEFEQNLENRKNLMLKEINYDLKKLNETEDKLRAVSEIMTVFSQKVVEQGTMTEQSSRFLKSRSHGFREFEELEASEQGVTPCFRVQ
jgi:hypothetical protein